MSDQQVFTDPLMGKTPWKIKNEPVVSPTLNLLQSTVCNDTYL